MRVGLGPDSTCKKDCRETKETWQVFRVLGGKGLVESCVLLTVKINLEKRVDVEMCVLEAMLTANEPLLAGESCFM